MNIIKDVLRPIRNEYRNLKNVRRAFACAKLVLNRGVYYVPQGTNVFCNVDKKNFSIFNLFCFRLYFNFKKRKGIVCANGMQLEPMSRIEFGLGMGKVVLLTMDKAYGFYYSKGLYLKAKNNYLRNYNSFKYPCIKIYGFEDSRSLIVMERINGKSIYDSEHDEMIVTSLLKFGVSTESRLSEDNEVLFLQHGDAKCSNIIWINDDYRFIDLDGLDFLPPLFDVFHYLAGYKLEDVIAILEKNIELVKEICKRANIDVHSNLLDILFSRFVAQYKKWGVCYGDFKFLNIDYTFKYLPQTANQLKSIYGDNRTPNCLKMDVNCQF